jgi:hypothetical protein
LKTKIKIYGTICEPKGVLKLDDIKALAIRQAIVVPGDKAVASKSKAIICGRGFSVKIFSNSAGTCRRKVGR